MSKKNYDAHALQVLRSLLEADGLLEADILEILEKVFGIK
jgi:hypothetical protein